MATRLVVAALVVAALAGAGPARPQATAPKRPFEHQRHERVSCRECHGTGPRHRTMLVRTATDCASCHHEPALAKSCAGCHAPDGLPTRARVTAVMELSVRTVSLTRDLPFGHDRHEAVACRDCHRAPVTLARDRECRTCHDQHHRAEANCSSCHDRTTPAAQRAHDAAAHLSCGGAGCHAAPVAPSPVLSRTLCLVCHAKQSTHEPGGPCATCHKIPAPARQPVVSAARGRETKR